MARTRATGGATEVVKDVRARARTEGIQAAYGAALAVCGDEKARAADRLDAANLICRIGGVFEGAGEEQDGKALSTMSRAELQAASVQAIAVLARLDAEDADGEDIPAIFD